MVTAAAVPVLMFVLGCLLGFKAGAGWTRSRYDLQALQDLTSRLYPADPIEDDECIPTRGRRWRPRERGR